MQYSNPRIEHRWFRFDPLGRSDNRHRPIDPRRGRSIDSGSGWGGGIVKEV